MKTWERFSAAGIAFSYPPLWTMGSTKVIMAYKGQMWVGPDTEGEGKLHLFWGPLEEMKHYGSAENQARQTLSSFRRDTMWSGGRAEAAQLDKIAVSDHEAYFAYIRAVRLAPGIMPFYPSRTIHEIEAAYFHCPNTDRYFVLVLEMPTISNKVENHLSDFTKEFSCHFLNILNSGETLPRA